MAAEQQNAATEQIGKLKTDVKRMLDESDKSTKGAIATIISLINHKKP